MGAAAADLPVRGVPGARPVTDPARVTEAEARAIWRRAAELHAEHASLPEGDTLPLAAVEAAAAEAGIAPEWVRRAAAELRGARADAGWWDRLAPHLVGGGSRSVAAQRCIPAPPRSVYRAMQRVFPAPPYSLVLHETLGEDPLDGAVLVFDVEAGSRGVTAFHNGLTETSMRELHVSLHPRGDACEVVVRSDLTAGIRYNALVGTTLAALTALPGAAAGTLVGNTALAATGAVLGLPAGGALLGGGAVALGWRALYRRGLRREEHMLHRLLGVLDSNVRTHCAFALPRRPAPIAGAGAASLPT